MCELSTFGHGVFRGQDGIVAGWLGLQAWTFDLILCSPTYPWLNPISKVRILLETW